MYVKDLLKTNGIGSSNVRKLVFGKYAVPKVSSGDGVEIPVRITYATGVPIYGDLVYIRINTTNDKNARRKLQDKEFCFSPNYLDSDIGRSARESKKYDNLLDVLNELKKHITQKDIWQYVVKEVVLIFTKGLLINDNMRFIDIKPNTEDYMYVISKKFNLDIVDDNDAIQRIRERAKRYMGMNIISTHLYNGVMYKSIAQANGQRIWLGENLEFLDHQYHISTEIGSAKPSFDEALFVIHTEFLNSRLDSILADNKYTGIPMGVTGDNIIMTYKRD